MFHDFYEYCENDFACNFALKTEQTIGYISNKTTDLIEHLGENVEFGTIGIGLKFNNIGFNISIDAASYTINEWIDIFKTRSIDHFSPSISVEALGLSGSVGLSVNSDGNLDFKPPSLSFDPGSVLKNKIKKDIPASGMKAKPSSNNFEIKLLGFKYKTNLNLDKFIKNSNLKGR